MNIEPTLIEANNSHLLEILNLNTALVHFLSPLDLTALHRHEIGVSCCI